MSSDHISGGGGASKKKKNHRSKPMVTASAAARSNSFPPEEEDYPMLKVSLTSISKLEVRNLKRKLMSELEEVRSLMTRFDTQNKKMKTGVNKKGTVQIFKSCNALLTKLMKHKDGWVFNVPVDAKVLGLHDYHSIVKEPMDLGTVKGKLGSGLYESPLDFAEDVRLTFKNAILYNPVGHEVHSMAKFFLKMFEEKWGSIKVQFDNLSRKVKTTRDVAFPRPVAAPVVEPLPAPSPSPPPPTLPPMVTLERAEEYMTTPVELETVTTTALEKPEEEEEEAPVDVRDLTMDEKRRLSEELQDLPYDKLETVVQIIKKSNPELSQQDDEIELDIDSLDIQTLWELYRFVIGYKESLSNKKEDQGFGSERDAESVHDTLQEPTILASGTETFRANESGKAIRMSSPGRQENNAGGSSSSNSSSSDTGSGSSDSDSDSSSGRGSDTGN
ncbi:unnamed protein product [Eruca vesicaria subsp. sativa]|uniref:Uncharacterized protein n=1 Tax=Eruca vesicaria subsp. sativa TaxID=29727 RepID=A0ABC8KFX3_ERUVS|nr:unnamed protein product [Eruca vesicaria subsp. sativa]